MNECTVCVPQFVGVRLAEIKSVDELLHSRVSLRTVLIIVALQCHGCDSVTVKNKAVCWHASKDTVHCALASWHYEMTESVMYQ